MISMVDRSLGTVPTSPKMTMPGSDSKVTVAKPVLLFSSFSGSSSSSSWEQTNKTGLSYSSICIMSSVCIMRSVCIMQWFIISNHTHFITVSYYYTIIILSTSYFWEKTLDCQFHPCDSNISYSCFIQVHWPRTSELSLFLAPSRCYFQRSLTHPRHHNDQLPPGSLHSPNTATYNYHIVLPLLLFLHQ